MHALVQQLHQRWYASVAAVALLALFSHIGTLRNGFVFDDRGAIVENPVVQGPLNFARLLRSDYWGLDPRVRGLTWRPPATLTFWIDRHLGGGAPWVFHATNLVFHAFACSALVLAVVRLSGSKGLALATGATFAVLAVNTEAVAGAVGRADEMAAMFGFLAVAFSPTLANRRREQLPLCCVLVFVALLCKESAIIFPAWIAVSALLSGNWMTTPESRRGLVRLCLSLGASVALYVLVRYTLFASVLSVNPTPMNNPLLSEPLSIRIYSGLGIAVELFRVILFPLRLSPDYSFAQLLPDRSAFAPGPMIGLAIVCSLLIGALKLRSRSSAWTLGAVWLLVGWLAISNILIPLPIVFAERLLYAVSAAAALLLAATAQILYRTRLRAVAVGALLLIISGNALRAAARDRDWVDELHLFTQASIDTPNSARVWNNLGASLMREGLNQPALVALSRASAIAPSWASPHTLTGIALSNLGRHTEALSALRTGYALESNDFQAAYNLAVFFVRARQFDEAAEVVERYLVSHPGAQEFRQLQDVIRLSRRRQ